MLCFQVVNAVCTTLNCTVLTFSDENSTETYYSNSSNTFMFGVSFDSDTNISSYEIRFPKDINIPTGAYSTQIGMLHETFNWYNSCVNNFWYYFPGRGPAH